MNKIIVVKNMIFPAEDIAFAGIPIPASSDITVTNDVLMRQLSYDNDFVNAVQNKVVVVNNGTDLNPWAAIHYMKERRPSILAVCFCDNTYSYARTYHKKGCRLKGNILFPGSDILGVPSAIVVNAHCSKSFCVRVQYLFEEETLVIAQKTFSSGVVDTVRLINLSNIPREPTTLEIYICPSIYRSNVQLYSLGFCW